MEDGRPSKNMRKASWQTIPMTNEKSAKQTTGRMLKRKKFLQRRDPAQRRPVGPAYRLGFFVPKATSRTSYVLNAVAPDTTGANVSPSSRQECTQYRECPGTSHQSTSSQCSSEAHGEAQRSGYLRHRAEMPDKGQGPKMASAAAGNENDKDKYRFLNCNDTDIGFRIHDFEQNSSTPEVKGRTEAKCTILARNWHERTCY